MKQGGVSRPSHGERSQTPSGPAGSSHCTPDSVHVSRGPLDEMLESQATNARSDPNRTARRIMDCGLGDEQCVRTGTAGLRFNFTWYSTRCRPTDRASVANHGASAVGPKPFGLSPDCNTGRLNLAVDRPLQALVMPQHGWKSVLRRARTVRRCDAADPRGARSQVEGAGDGRTSAT